MQKKKEKKKKHSPSNFGSRGHLLLHSRLDPPLLGLCNIFNHAPTNNICIRKHGDFEHWGDLQNKLSSFLLFYIYF